MQRGKKLQHYVGKNEKTKIMVKIQKVVSISASVKICGIHQDVPSHTVDSILCFSSERAGGASEGALGHRRPAETDDDALLPAAGGAKGERGSSDRRRD